MAIKHHCDHCDAITRENADNIELMFEATTDHSFHPIVARGELKLTCNGKSILLCNQCVKDLFVNNKKKVTSFPYLNLMDSLVD